MLLAFLPFLSFLPLPFAPVLPVLSVLVAAPPGPEDGCPSARQVTDAMQVRIPNHVVLPDQSGVLTRSDVLRSVLDIAPDGTVVRFALLDARGDTQLRRALPAPGRGRPVAECLALADTVAAIVERYLSTIAYETADSNLPGFPQGDVATASPTTPAAAPALAVRPRSALLAAGIGWRTTAGGQGQSGLELKVGAQFEVTLPIPRMAVSVSVGASPGITADLADAPRTVTLRRFPLRLGALLEMPAGPGFVEPVVQAGADLFVLSSTAGQAVAAAVSTGLAPVVEAGVGYRLKIAGRFFLRPGIAIGFALKRYATGVREEPGELPLSTPWAYASFGIDTAMVFR